MAFRFPSNNVLASGCVLFTPVMCHLYLNSLVLFLQSTYLHEGWKFLIPVQTVIEHGAMQARLPLAYEQMRNTKMLLLNMQTTPFSITNILLS